MSGDRKGWDSQLAEEKRVGLGARRAFEPPCLLFFTPAATAPRGSAFSNFSRFFQAHGPGGDVTGIPQAAKEANGKWRCGNRRRNA